MAAARQTGETGEAGSATKRRIRPAAARRGFDVPLHPVDVPTLYVTGADDGCALPCLADGQEALFTGGYCSETWGGVGHYPHLERAARTADAVLGWLGAVG